MPLRPRCHPRHHGPPPMSSGIRSAREPTVIIARLIDVELRDAFPPSRLDRPPARQTSPRPGSGGLSPGGRPAPPRRRACPAIPGPARAHRAAPNQPRTTFDRRVVALQTGLRQAWSNAWQTWTTSVAVNRLGRPAVGVQVSGSSSVERDEAAAPDREFRWCRSRFSAGVQRRGEHRRLVGVPSPGCPWCRRPSSRTRCRTPGRSRAATGRSPCRAPRALWRRP